jgi:hypothetical protein
MFNISTNYYRLCALSLPIAIGEQEVPHHEKYQVFEILSYFRVPDPENLFHLDKV